MAQHASSAAKAVPGFARTPRAESGQVIVVFMLFLVVLLGMAAFVIDIGYAYYTKRQMQAQVDAAALAGSQELPNPDMAEAVAYAYGGSAGQKNAKANVPGVETKVRTSCVEVAPCNPVNAVIVEQTAAVDTKFAGILGFDTFTVRARAIACSPCGARPLDILLVLDVTGSMCQDHWGTFQSGCPDLRAAKQGLKDFIAFMDPSIDAIGLAVFPPPTSVSRRCSLPRQSNYDSRSSPYVVVPLAQDYKVGNQLNTSSDLVKTVECLQANDTTSFATALEHAQAELDRSGREDAQDVIVFFSDGAANYGPSYYGNSSRYRTRPCSQAVSSAAGIKGKGTIVYAIGYDLDAQNGGANVCKSYTGALERPSISAYQTLEQIAGAPERFHNTPDPDDLKGIYTQIASDISGSRLLDDGLM
jgi:Putative Flp pilus-assembly TadE/G-like/von Willebrand factor type A domain